MGFDQIAREYFAEIKRDFEIATTTGEATPELSYRPSLNNFLKKIISADNEIAMISEPRNQGKTGRPDWRFHNTTSMGVYGYIEAKGIDPKKSIDLAPYSNQIDRYLLLGNPVVLTDGAEFIFFSQGNAPQRYDLFEKPIDWNNPKINFHIETMFSKLFNKVGYRTVSESQLTNEVAKRAKLLTEDINELLGLEDDEAENENERITLKLLKDLQQTAELSHDKSLSNKSIFASFISQILTFGLLYAHRVIDSHATDPADKYERIHKFWFSYLEEEYSNKLLPFKSLVNALRSELDSDLSRLGLLYDDLRRLLAHVKLTSKQISLPDFHELYETFLADYDPKTRFDYGAFYTPNHLAVYTVEVVKAVINNFFKVHEKSTKFKIIDPCCGTGTFIEVVLKHLPAANQSEIIGFEILPAPYALSHYRMAMLDGGYPKNIRIILTNTLSDNLFEQSTNDPKNEIGNILLKEQLVAYDLALPPLTLIIGNPPSSDSQFKIDNEGEKIRTLIEDFRPSTEQRKSRQNTQKQLQNEFIKFLRWSVDRAMRSAPSVFALIIPSSFAKHPSYKFARKFLLENFSSLWVFEFDADNRAGVEAANIFETLQGRLLLIGTYSGNNTSPASIHYKSIVHLSKNEKNKEIQNLAIDLNDWELLPFNAESYTLKPEENYDREKYAQFWNLTNENNTGVFIRHCSSVKLAPTHLLVHSSAGQLKRRSKYIGKEENEFQAIYERWYSGQKKPPAPEKITSDVKGKLNNAIDSGDVFGYSYRPFVECHVVLNAELLKALSSLGGGGTRDRPEIRIAYSDERVFGFAVAPAPEDIGDSLHKFTSFCWHLPDNDLSARGNAHIFCNYFPEYKTKKNWDSTVKTNVNNELLLSLSSRFEIPHDDIINAITFYSYAILSSDFYLEMFKGKLFNVAGEWPRIPITTDKTLFLKVSEFGMRLAKIESRGYNTILNTSKSEIEFFKFKIEENKILLLDEAGKVTYKSEDVADAVLDFEVSGYTVVREWLKMHSSPYYRKSFGSQEFAEFDALLRKIEEYLLVIGELDDSVERIIKGELLSPRVKTDG